MLDEEMDDIIRNAAAKHHPAYNDQAWEKMEAQLDKHLPQKPDRRRFVFFLLLLLLLGGGALYSVVYFAGNKNSAGTKIADANTSKDAPANAQTGNALPANGNTEKSATNNGTEDAATNADLITNPVSPNNSEGNDISVLRGNKQTENDIEPGNNKKSSSSRRGKTNMRVSAPAPFDQAQVPPGRITTATGGDPFYKDIKARKTKTGTPSEEEITGQNAKTDPSKNKNTKGKLDIAITNAAPEDNAVDNNPVKAKEEEKITTGQKTETVKKDKELKKEKEIAKKEDKPSAEKKKTARKPASNFGLTVSAGPDLSFVKLNKLGKATLLYGAGLSYNFAKRFTARAGFYVSRKIYSATPDQYEMPGGIAYPYLYEIGANCNIYEIPVGLNYDFVQRKKYNLFAGAGLSSYLMKTEDYDYRYDYNGQAYNYKTGVKNENKHYFSVLTLSAGYQYKISNRVSIQAEPYVKLPLGGVGVGKIKLNSSGVLFTATIKPFAKKK